MIGKSTICLAKQSISEVLFDMPRLEVITPSHWMKSQFVSALPELRSSSTMIPNIINHPEVKSFEFYPSGILNVVFISANLSTPVKGLKNLISAIVEFDLTSKIRLHLVGTNNIRILPKNLDFHFYGQLVPSQVSKIMENSDLLVVPSLTENSPNVIAEAQLLGLPVLASNVGGNSELVEHAVTGFLMNPDIESLGLELTRLLSKPKFADISVNALNFAKNHWDNTRNISGHLDVYRRVIG